jgi:hypothetical protein
MDRYFNTETSTEEMDVLDPSNDCRHYKVGDKVRVHSGGEGIIRGVMYCILVGEQGPEDARLVRGEEIGEIIG